MAFKKKSTATKMNTDEIKAFIQKHNITEMEKWDGCYDGGSLVFLDKPLGDMIRLYPYENKGIVLASKKSIRAFIKDERNKAIIDSVLNHKEGEDYDNFCEEYSYLLKPLVAELTKIDDTVFLYVDSIDWILNEIHGEANKK